MRVLTILLLTLFTINVSGQDKTPRTASNDRRSAKVANNRVKTKEKVKSEKQTKGTLVTKGMATKIAVVLLKGDANAFEHKIFMMYNNIENLITEAKLLRDVYNNLDCIENFIIGIYEWCDKSQVTSYLHKTFVLDWDECVAAEKIYLNWVEDRKEQAIRKELNEKQEELEKEQRQYDSWVSTGDIPTISEKKLSKKAVLSAKSLELFKEKILNVNDTFYYQRFLPTRDFWGEEKPRRNIESLIEFNVEIDKHNNVTLQDETYKFKNDFERGFQVMEQHEYQDLFKSLGLIVLKPAQYTFKELNKTIDVPSRARIVIRLTASRNDEFKCVIGNYNKKTKQWDFGKNNYEMYIRDGEWWTIKGAYHQEHYTRSKEIVSKGQMTDEEIEQLRYICNQKKWADDTKKKVLSFVTYEVNVEVMGIEESIKINVPSKIGFAGSFEK